jgi:hypothetical protein
MNAVPAKNLSSQSRSLLARLKREKATCLTDRAGRPTAYLVAADTFDGIQSRLHLLEGIVRGEKAIREGRVYTQAEARMKLGRWLKK